MRAKFLCRMRVNELLDAVGQNWGVDPTYMKDIDLEEIVSVAMKVKEGKLPPNSYVRRPVYGIWPPELLPILVRQGGLPGFVDETASIVSIPPYPPSSSPPFLSSLERLIQERKKSSVRFKVTDLFSCGIYLVQYNLNHDSSSERFLRHSWDKFILFRILLINIHLLKTKILVYMHFKTL